MTRKLYVAAFHGAPYYKIGFAIEPARRVKSIIRGLSPKARAMLGYPQGAIEVLFVSDPVADYREAERLCHDILRRSGHGHVDEWFKCGFTEAVTAIGLAITGVRALSLATATLPVREASRAELRAERIRELIADIESGGRAAFFAAVELELHQRNIDVYALDGDARYQAISTTVAYARSLQRSAVMHYFL